MMISSSPIFLYLGTTAQLRYAVPLLSTAISKIQKEGRLDIVIFGHTHNQLKRNLGERKMFVVDKRGTAYLNCAVVPRYKKNENDEIIINFSWIEFHDNKLSYISQRWYTELGDIFCEDKLFPD